MLSIIVPTKNEEQGISKVIADIEKQDLHNFEILVVDNSTDKTRYKVTKLIRKYNNLRLVGGSGGGKGAAMKLGVEEAKGDKICFLDGDGTYPPKAIPRMFKLLKYCDVVIASRLLEKENEKFSFETFFTYEVLPFLFGGYFKKFKTSEPTSGMRMMKKETWKKLDLKSENFMIETEMEVKMAKNKMHVIEIPIPRIKRLGGHSKFLRSWGTILKIRKLIKANEKYLNNLKVTKMK